MTIRPRYSIIMMAESEENDVTAYLSRIHEMMTSRAGGCELIVAVNGVGSAIRAQLDAWPVDGPPVYMYERTRRIPPGAVLQDILLSCRGEIVLVCGPYQQICDAGLHELLDMVDSGRADLALPWRCNRVDSLVNQWQSRFFNLLVRLFTGTDLHDLSSNVRVFRRQILEEVVLYGDLYRYLPLIAKKRGFRVLEIEADHVQERGEGGYYGLLSYVNRLADIVTMGFNFGFARQPLRYFGPRGMSLIFPGILCFAVAISQKVMGNGALGDSRWLMAGLALNMAGFILWGVGLLGEVVAFTVARKHKEYVVETIIGSSTDGGEGE